MDHLSALEPRGARDERLAEIVRLVHAVDQSFSQLGIDDPGMRASLRDEALEQIRSGVASGVFAPAVLALLVNLVALSDGASGRIAAAVRREIGNGCLLDRPGRAMDLHAGARVALRFGVPVRTVVSVLREAIETLQDRDRFIAESNCMEARPFPEHELGTPRIPYWQTNVREAYVDFIDDFDPRVLIPSEPEGGIRNHPTFARYVELFRAGFKAPYVSVFEDANGKLISGNRRRVLAAQEACVETLRGWRSAHNHETGLPLKFGDIESAYRDALSERVRTAMPEHQAAEPHA
ncbi:MAG: hypothetical protein VB131_01820 [Burkholderia gladioli]